jgi:hypothetical protein
MNYTPAVKETLIINFEKSYSFELTPNPLKRSYQIFQSTSPHKIRLTENLFVKGDLRIHNLLAIFADLDAERKKFQINPKFLVNFNLHLKINCLYSLHPLTHLCLFLNKSSYYEIKTIRCKLDKSGKTY